MVLQLGVLVLQVLHELGVIRDNDEYLLDGHTLHLGSLQVLLLQHRVVREEHRVEIRSLSFTKDETQRTLKCSVRYCTAAMVRRVL